RNDSAASTALLAELVLEANPEQFRVVFPPLRRRLETHHGLVEKHLGDELARLPAPRWDDVRLADLRPPDPAIVARLEDPSVGGRCRDRFAFCQALPLEEFSPMAGALSSRGYRPSCVRPYAAGERVLVAAVWTRDGLGWHCELDLTGPQARATGEAFR